MLGDQTAHHQRGEAISFIWVFLQLSLCLISGFSVCFHMPPKFHNRASLCCSMPCQHLSYQYIRLEGANCLLNLTFSGTLKHKRLLSHSLCHMASAWSCIKQKPRNLRQVSEQGRTLSSLLPPPSTLSLLYTHMHPTRWPPPPYAKNYHTSFSLYPYLNMMEKNWAFIWGGGCVFIQQRQHQETRESPHCCWWKQERVGDCGAGGRRGERRLGEREKEKGTLWVTVI